MTTRLDARMPVPVLALALSAVFLLFAAWGCAQQDETSASGADTSAAAEEAAAEGAPPDTISIRDPGLHPEGVEWDGERSRFLVSSVTRGSVTAVEDDGSHSTFASGEEITSSIGIHIDPSGERLLVAASDLGAAEDTSVQGDAKLAVYDLADGEREHLVDLAGLRPDSRHFANDVTAGPDGAAYVTDSFSPVIYRVTPEGDASVFVEDPRLGGEGFGLNGIDYHADDFLLVAMAADRTLYRVPIEAPQELTEVELPEPIAADGLVLRPNGNIIAVATTFSAEGEPASEVIELGSDDGWSSAGIVGRAATAREASATTATLREDAVYVVNARFADIEGEQPAEAFEIFRVDPR